MAEDTRTCHCLGKLLKMPVFGNKLSCTIVNLFFQTHKGKKKQCSYFFNARNVLWISTNPNCQLFIAPKLIYTHLKILDEC